MGPVTEHELGPPSEGWAAFYAANGDALLRSAVASLGRDARAGVSAEDIVNEVLAKLIKRGIPRSAIARAYVFTSIKNAARDTIAMGGRFTDDEVHFDERIGVEDIENLVDDALLGDDVVAALEELPERESRAIREKVMNNRHWSEVAPELGVTTSQGLGKIVNSGLDKLRKMPRFAELTPPVSSSPSPSTVTDEARGKAP